jgi:hypothetical protein
VTAIFESGTIAAGTVVIGTDGPNSTVRKILLGDKAASLQLDVVLYNVNVCYGDAEKALEVRKLHPLNTVALQPDIGLSLWTSSKFNPSFQLATNAWQSRMFQIQKSQKAGYSK